MKISYNWLKRYASFDMEPDEAARLLTSGGLEVEGLEKFESVRGGLQGVVIGQVMECSRHPNAEKLTLTKVDIGAGRLLSIVCGAPNVAPGQKVPVATVGTVLYSGENTFEIKEAKIRGEFSEGMICAEDELGLGTSHEGIMVLDTGARIGMEAAEYFRVTTDHVFEIGLTPNRTDATSHLGVARDLVALLNSQNTTKKYSFERPSVDDFAPDDHSLEIPVIVEDTEACPRYSGLTMTGVKVGESPFWLKDILNAAGIRPINNIVDITNFVLMEFGQPLHAFDAAEIKGGKVIVRKAHSDERFVTLDEIQRKLTPDDLMICNAESGMCIAGVFGGVVSGVTGKTTSLFLESAHFSPRSIRKTSRYHGLQTDASFRFERGTDPNITVYALKRAALLIREIAGGRISSGIVDIYPEPVAPTSVTVTWNNVNRLIGKVIDREIIKDILQDLEIKIGQETNEELELFIPTFKTDVLREADVIEEILRIYGYDQVEMTSQLRSSLSFSQKPDPERLRDMVSEMLSHRGYHEIMNNSLTREKYADESPWLDTAASVKLLNPLSSDLNVMRQTLLFGGLETIAYNQNRKANDLRLYEFGRVYRLKTLPNGEKDLLGKYHEEERLAIFMTGRKEPESWRTGDQPIDLFDMKEAVMAVMTRLGFPMKHLEMIVFSDDLFREGIKVVSRQATLVLFGLLAKKVLKRFDLKQDVCFADLHWEEIIRQVATNKAGYREIPKFPEVRRDLALVLDQQVTYEELEKAAYQAEKHLLRSVSLFDIYQGEKIGPGKKSYAMSFILRDDDKTLTDKVIEQTMDKILRIFKEKFNATVR
ncbi:MAG: phenylalanine--tRNA ligase subunit beta [Bacteroidales bacterium]|nr:phenylalanine--tRNA ligase subunit beta [Bacteroidales bacterium]